MKEKMVPKLRFPGFTDPWEQRKGGEVFANISEKGYGDLLVLSASQELGMISREDIGVDIKYDKKSLMTYKRVKPGHFVIHLRSFQGGFAYSEVMGITSPAYTVLEFLNKESHASLFWKENFLRTRFVQSLEVLTYGIRDGRSISFSDFQNMKLTFPAGAEQMMIGEYLAKVSKYITFHQRKLENLQKLKKGLLQKMFPKEGEDKPELRFPGFTDAWEKRRLGDVLNERSVLQVKSDEFPLVSFTVEEGVIPKKQRYEREQLVVGNKESKKYKVTKLNDIVYNPANLKFGAINRNKFGNAVFSPIYVTFEVNKDIALAEFMELIIRKNSFIERALDYQEGTVYERMAVKPKDLCKMKIRVTNKKEQSTIINLLGCIDTLITLHQRKLEHLKELKKGLLQQMFV